VAQPVRPNTTMAARTSRPVTTSIWSGTATRQAPVLANNARPVRTFGAAAGQSQSFGAARSFQSTTRIASAGSFRAMPTARNVGQFRPATSFGSGGFRSSPGISSSGGGFRAAPSIGRSASFSAPRMSAGGGGFSRGGASFGGGGGSRGGGRR
jgi:hypothetical protein